MNCDEFQTLLEAAIDRQLDGDSGLKRDSDLGRDSVADTDRQTVMAELEAHATGCETCRERWQDFVLLERAVTDWRAQLRTPQLSGEFTERVLLEVRAAGLPSDEAASLGTDETKTVPLETRRAAASTAREPKPIRAWEILVTVALVLIAVLVVFHDGNDQLANNDVEKSPTAPFETSPDDELVDLSDLLSDARIVLSSLTERASQKAGGFRVFVPDVSNSFTLERDASSTTAPAIEPETRPVDDGSSDSDPDDSGHDGFRRALDFLFEATGPPDQQTT